MASIEENDAPTAGDSGGQSDHPAAGERDAHLGEAIAVVESSRVLRSQRGVLRTARGKGSRRRHHFHHIQRASFELDVAYRAWCAPSSIFREYAAGELGIATSDILLVAAHSWDVAGAMAAGCKAAFVQRPGKPLSPLGKKPDLIVRDLRDLGRKLK